MIKYAQGCLAGLCVGDALGSQFEFMHPFAIDLLDNKELSMMTGSKIFNSLPGQITDDGEMAMCLVNSLIDNNFVYDKELTRQHYYAWAKSSPIDMGFTIRNSVLYNILNPQSESNGALMRVAPLAIAYSDKKYGQIINAAYDEASITHANKKVADCNSMFCLAIACILNNKDMKGKDVVEKIRHIGEQFRFDLTLLDASVKEPEDFYTSMGHVDIAFQNAFYHLRYETDFTNSIIKTIRHGGDTDTNAAICGALMGAYYGVDGIPYKWLDTVINCKPDRPASYYTTNILTQAEKLLTKKK